jgi:biopolymer transport protein ExbD
MASVGGPGNSGHGAELNLVPFIDLLSTLVIFLITTAVWTQVAAISVDKEIPKSGRNPQSIQYDQIDLILGPQGFVMEFTGSKRGGAVTRETIKKIGSEYDFDHLGKRLKELVHSYSFATITVGADDRIEYSKVVRALDLAKSIGFSSVGLAED